MTPAPIVQFNARVPERLRQKIKQDAARTGETIDTIATGMIRFFFQEVSVARRREIYHGSATARRKGRDGVGAGEISNATKAMIVAAQKARWARVRAKTNARTPDLDGGEHQSAAAPTDAPAPGELQAVRTGRLQPRRARSDAPYRAEPDAEDCPPAREEHSDLNGGGHQSAATPTETPALATEELSQRGGKDAGQIPATIAVSNAHLD